MVQVSDENTYLAAVAAPGPEPFAQRARVRRASLAIPWTLLAWGTAAIVLALALVAAVRWTMPQRMTVQVAVDGQVEAVTSLRPTVGALLVDLGVRLRPEDRLEPAAETPLAPQLAVRIERARRYILEVDGDAHTTYSHARTVGVLLDEASVILKPADEVWLDGVEVNPETTLPDWGIGPKVAGGGPAPGRGPARAWQIEPPAPVRLAVRRSVPITIADGSVPYAVYTTQPTLGEALAEAGLTLYLGDRIEPALGTAVRPGLRVFIARSKSVLVSADGHTLHTRTQGHTVGDALVDLGVYVSGADRVSPALDRAIADNMEIRVNRVRETVSVEREIIPYESIMVPDDGLEIDSQRLAQAGDDGEFRRRFRLMYEDGQETNKSLMDAWVAAEPVTRITAFGRKLVSRPLETPDGQVSYWRKVRMYATSYSAARSGTPRSAPWYGRTRIGLTLRKGIVAVDPNVIPLRSRVYVPGYGVAIAGDTGGGIRGKWIDLGFEDNNYESWHRWVDVYVLDPPPAQRQIRWVLPNYPPPGFPNRRR